MAVMPRATNRAVVQTRTPITKDVMQRVNAILGYDLQETEEIRQDSDLYRRILVRLGTSGKTVPVDQIVGDLDDDSE